MPQDGPQKAPGGPTMPQDSPRDVFLRGFLAGVCRPPVFLRVREAQGEPRRPTHTCFYVFSVRVAAAQGWSRRPIHTCFTRLSLRVARIICVFTCRR